MVCVCLCVCDDREERLQVESLVSTRRRKVVGGLCCCCCRVSRSKGGSRWCFVFTAMTSAVLKCCKYFGSGGGGFRGVAIANGVSVSGVVDTSNTRCLTLIKELSSQISTWQLYNKDLREKKKKEVEREIESCSIIYPYSPSQERINNVLVVYAQVAHLTHTRYLPQVLKEHSYALRGIYYATTPKPSLFPRSALRKLAHCP